VLTDDGGRYRITRPDSPVSTGAGPETAGLDLDAALAVLETQVQVFVGLRATNRIFVHAGVVGHHGRAIVIPGLSFAGKSTLVFALVRGGAVYYSDEFAVIDERGLVHPYSAPLWLRDPPPPRAYDLKRFGGQGSEPLPVGAVVVTSYRAGAEWNPTRLTPGRGALAMLGNALSALTRPRESVDLITRAVDGAVVLEGERGEAEDVARALLQTLSANLSQASESRDLQGL
jgi:hypothetical protein